MDCKVTTFFRNGKTVSDYVRYLGNQRWHSLDFDYLFEDNRTEPENMK